jgi:hypothetical protein
MDRAESVTLLNDMCLLRFSTPVRDCRTFGPIRIASFGEARWEVPEGEFTYGEFHVQDVEYNGAARP